MAKVKHYINYYLAAKPMTMCGKMKDHDDCTNTKSHVSCKKCKSEMRQMK